MYRVQCRLEQRYIFHPITYWFSPHTWNRMLIFSQFLSSKTITHLLCLPRFTPYFSFHFFCYSFPLFSLDIFYLFFPLLSTVYPLFNPYLLNFYAFFLKYSFPLFPFFSYLNPFFLISPTSSNSYFFPVLSKFPPYFPLFTLFSLFPFVPLIFLHLLLLFSFALFSSYFFYFLSLPSMTSLSLYYTPPDTRVVYSTFTHVRYSRLYRIKVTIKFWEYHLPLRSGYSSFLKSYLNRISARNTDSDSCPDCNQSPHTTEHLFNCPAKPTNLTPRVLRDQPHDVAFHLGLETGREHTVNWSNSGLQQQRHSHYYVLPLYTSFLFFPSFGYVYISLLYNISLYILRFPSGFLCFLPLSSFTFILPY